MLSVEEAQREVLALIRPTGTETVPFEATLHRVLRQNVIAGCDVPSFDNSAMDGYAIVSHDTEPASARTPVVLNVTGDAAAGSSGDTEVTPGSAMRIMTGAPLPTGADAVVAVELTDAGEREVRVFAPVGRGANVRRAGEDIRRGETALAEGTVIGPAELGMLAALGHTEVRVARRPVVSIIATGSELIEPHEPRTHGKVVNTNSYALAALVEQCGATPRLLRPVADELEATIDAIRGATDGDFLVTTGGVSVGAYDFVKDALDALGAETKFWRVAMKPGKPVVVSELGGRVVFGFPGNPVSCMVAFHLFAAPAIRKALGIGSVLPPVVRTVAASAMTHRGDRRAYHRVRVTAVDGTLVSTPMRAQGSGILSSMVGANGLAVIEPGRERVEAGEQIDTVLIGPI